MILSSPTIESLLLSLAKNPLIYLIYFNILLLIFHPPTSHPSYQNEHLTNVKLLHRTAVYIFNKDYNTNIMIEQGGKNNQRADLIQVKIKTMNGSFYFIHVHYNGTVASIQAQI